MALDGTPSPQRGEVESNAAAADRVRARSALPEHEDANPGLVRVGEFGRAHGLAGEVRLKSHTADPLAIGRYGPLATADGRSFTLSKLRPAPGEAPDLLVVRVEGVGSREAAEALTRLALFVPRDRLAPPEDEDEFYLVDLVGLAALDAAGQAIGRVVAVPDYGGGPLLEIAPDAGGPTLLIPFTRAFVPAVDLAAGRIVVEQGQKADDASEPPPL